MMSAEKIAVSAVAEGNTNSSAKSKEVKRYCFTLNNYSDKEVDELTKSLLSLNTKYIFGYEVGESGTPHLQGYFELPRKKSFSSMINLLNNKRIHLECAKGSQDDNIKYCSKDNNYKTNFSIRKPFIQEIPTFYTWQTQLKAIIESEPDNRTLHYIWEPNGCTGKTTFQKWIFTHFNDVVVLSGKGADMKNGIVMYIDKNKVCPRIVLINIPRTAKDYVCWSGIEEIKDMFFFSGKYEGGMICDKSPHIFIFANQLPDLENVSKDRWKIGEIVENCLLFK